MNELYELNHNFLEYAKRRKFSPSLINILLKIIKQSHKNNDGMIWTDSLLLYLLKEQNKTSEYLGEFPGIRGGIITNLDLKGTFTNQCLIYEPSFHQTIDDEIIAHNYKFPNEQIDENKIVELEINNAIDTYGHSCKDIEASVSLLIDKCNWKKLDVMFKVYYGLINVFILCRTLNIHPFEIFESNAQTLFERKYPFKIHFKRFLIKLRDSLHISISDFENEEIDVMANSVGENYFRYFILESDENIKEITYDYHKSGCYLSENVENFGGSILALSHRMNFGINSYDKLWPKNEHLLIYLHENKLKTTMSDYYGFGNPNLVENMSLANLNLIQSNPIWNETIIENFEYLINKPNVKESELQTFFEVYPQLLLTDLYTTLYPQITLIENSSRKLRPDFLIRKNNSINVDIVEIKKPVNKILYKGTSNRPRFIDELSYAISQLNDYKEWFQQNENRKKIRDKYGVDGFEPTLTLVIGRKNSFKNEEIRKRLFRNEGINLLTYDDLLELAKKRQGTVR